MDIQYSTVRFRSDLDENRTLDNNFQAKRSHSELDISSFIKSKDLIGAKTTL